MLRLEILTLLMGVLLFTMRFSDFINIAGKDSSYPVHPILLNRIGINETLLLCRLAWWQKDIGEWVEKTTEQVKEQTGLSYKQQTTARANLEKRGLIEQEYLRLQHTLRFRIKADALEQEITTEAPAKREDGETPSTPEHVTKSQMANCQNVISTNNGKDIVKKEDEPPNSEMVQVFNQWNKTAKGSNLPNCLVLSKERKTSLKARFKDKFFAANWEAALKNVAASNFCNGQNNRGWQADFEWFISPGAVPKIMEGKYDNRKPVQQEQEQERYV